MTKKQIEQEFKKIDYELFVNRPNFTPYPPDVIKRREYLLFAQVHLSNILGAKRDERFESEMYNKVMETYYNWDKNSKEKTLKGVKNGHK
ncbi:MAG: hypothetical protein Q7J67_02815 [bacterium]|nr:hypothetical protein [bacterium]